MPAVSLLDSKMFLLAGIYDLGKQNATFVCFHDFYVYLHKILIQSALMLQFLLSPHDSKALGNALETSYRARYDLIDVSEIKQKTRSLLEFEANLVGLDEETLRQKRDELLPMVELALQFSKLANQSKDFLPWLEQTITKKVSVPLLELLRIAHRIDQKIDAILTEPDPDENDPDFLRFLVKLAEEEGNQKIGKASTSLRESLGL